PPALARRAGDGRSRGRGEPRAGAILNRPSRAPLRGSGGELYPAHSTSALRAAPTMRVSSPTASSRLKPTQGFPESINLAVTLSSVLPFAHEALAGRADERHRLGEQHAHRIAQRDRLLVRRPRGLELTECSGGELDRSVQRQGRELLALRLLHRLRLLLRKLAEAAQEIFGIAAEGEAFHGHQA